MDGERTRLVVVAGLDRSATAASADRLMRAGPRVVVVHHDLRAIGEGVVHRRVRSTAGETTDVLELAHGCVSCTLREDVLPLLRRLADRPDVTDVVLHLDPVMEPEQVCWTLASVLVGDTTITDLVDLQAVLTVIDEDTWLADATSDENLDELSDRDLGVPPDDDRTLAQVAVGQVAFADAIVVAGRAGDAWTAARLAAVLDRLAPAAPRARHENLLGPAELPALLAAVPPSARRGEVDDPHAPLLRGAPPLEPDCGVALTLFTDRRPFHPQRLHEAIDVLLEGVIHTKGRAWVASQPDVALWLESAGGGLRVGHAGAWLATADDHTWDRVPAERRAKAALDWHPTFGDRTQELAILTHQASPGTIVAALRAALLTDDELAAGEDTWRHYPDPFGSWHTDPCDDLDTDLDTADTSTLDNRKDRT